MLALRLSRKLTRAAFHCSAARPVPARKKIYGKGKSIPLYREDLKNFDVSTHLHKELQANFKNDWEKLRVSIIGLPVNEHSLVTRVNVDTVLWQEIVKFGSLDKALDYIDKSGLAEDKSQSGLLKILRDLVNFKK